MKRLVQAGFLWFVFAVILNSSAAWGRDFGVQDAMGEIRRFNAPVIQNRFDLFQRKCDALTWDSFYFLRGSTHLMYQDIEKTPRLAFLKTAPQGLIAADLHLHNFGVLYFPGKKGGYSPEDLDEAVTGPLSYDVFRLGVSLQVGFKDALDRKDRGHAVKSLINGYIEGLSQGNNPDWPDCTLPKPLRHFIEDSIDQGVKSFLKKFTVAESPNRFGGKKDFFSLPAAEEAFVRAILVEYFEAQARRKNLPKDCVKILDIVIRENKGVSSIGLKRYSVLLQGSSADWKDSRIVELKEIRPSSAGKSTTARQSRDTLRGLALAHRDRDVFMGALPIGNKIFLVREIFPWAGRMEADAMKKDDIPDIVRALGAIASDFHMGSGDAGKMAAWMRANRQALEEAIEAYADQVRDDWKDFKKRVKDKGK